MSPVANTVACGVIDCASPVGSDAVTVNMPNGTAVSICRYCAEERITWSRWKPYQNNTPISRPCPHCRVRIAAGALCSCTKRPGDPNYEHPPQLFAGERDLITRLDNFITKRFPNQIRGDEHPCDSAIRILGDLAKRM